MSVLSYASPPSFHQVTLPDSSTIEDAVRLVHSARGRSNDSSSSSAAYIASRISELTGAADVGSLRRLTDGDWRSMELPAMAALYLRYAMRQSSRGTSSLLLSPLQHASPSSFSVSSPSASSSAFPTSASFTAFPFPPSSPVDPVLSALQLEFQLPAPIDMAHYAASLSILQSMGFNRAESLEALVVTDNKGEDVAVNYLFADPARRQKLKEDTKKRLLAATTTTTTISLASPSHARSPSSSLPSLPVAGGGGGPVERLVLYRELVRGVLLDERLTRRSYDALKAERDKRKVSKAEEKGVLKELGITEDRWDKLRRQKGRPVEGQAAGGEGVDLDCVVCLDAKKDHVCMPCGHVCMCAECAASVVKSRGKDGNCPMCHKKVDDCIRVFL